jgi:hypothetical protein
VLKKLVKNYVIFFALGTSVLLIPTDKANSLGNDPSDTVHSDLAATEAMFSDVYSFLAALYDVESGGFFESLKDRDSKKPPSIEASARARALLEEGGVLSILPEQLRRSMAQFYLSRQDPKTGYFEDPTTASGNRAERNRGRALSYSVGALKKLGHEPKDSPADNPAPRLSVIPSQFKSTSAFRSWIRGQPWKRSGWLAGDNVQSQIAVLQSVPQPLRDELIEVLFAELPRFQNPDDFFFGSGDPYVRLSGAFKIALIYKHFDRPIPKAQHLYVSTLKCLRTQSADNACYIRNTMSILQKLEDSEIEIPAADRIEIIHRTAANLRHFHRPDGGFALDRNTQFGSTNGCTQAMITRSSLYRMAGSKLPFLPNGHIFLETLTKRGVIIPKKG